MRNPICGLTAALVLTLLAISCGKSEEETQKFNRADQENFKRDMSDLTSFKLSNGLTVFLQEERTDQQVAICAVYHAGYIRDPKGKVQLAHVTEHMALKCASGPYKPGETMSIVQDHKGRISAEAVSDFLHIDYVVDGAKLDETLAIEASRLKELQCDQATLDQARKDVVAEIPASLQNPKGNLTRMAVSALAHIMYYGETNLPVQASVAKLTLDDVHRFHKTSYRPDDMLLVLIGNFKKADAEALVRKHFESIPSRPAPPEPTFVTRRSTRATWDVPAQVVFFTSPGPFDPKERLVLTMFGAFLQQLFSSTPEIYENCQTVYTSNQAYPVGRLPFFIYIQASEGFTTDKAAPHVFSRLDQAIQSVMEDDRRIELIKTGMVSFVTSTSLKEDEPDYPMMHFQVIGQEALNVCLRNLALEGRTTDAFVEEVNAITPEEFRAVLKKRLDRSALLTVSIEPRT